MVQRYDRQSIGRSISPRVATPGKILRMCPFVQGDRWDIAVQMDRLGIRVEVITAKDPARNQCLTENTQGPDRVTPRPSHRTILCQPLGILPRPVLIEPHFDMLQLVGSKVLCDRRFGRLSNSMVVDPRIPQQELRGYPDDPTHRIEYHSGLAPFDRGLVGLDQLRRNVLFGVVDRFRGQNPTARPHRQT